MLEPGGRVLLYWPIRDVHWFRVPFRAKIPELNRKIRQKFLNQVKFRSSLVSRLDFVASLRLEFVLQKQVLVKSVHINLTIAFRRKSKSGQIHIIR